MGFGFSLHSRIKSYTKFNSAALRPISSTLLVGFDKRLRWLDRMAPKMCCPGEKIAAWWHRSLMLDRIFSIETRENCRNYKKIQNTNSRTIIKFSSNYCNRRSLFSSRWFCRGFGEVQSFLYPFVCVWNRIYRSGENKNLKNYLKTSLETPRFSFFFLVSLDIKFRAGMRAEQR